jgi:DNA-binding LytR/AlgR family response regulator
MAERLADSGFIRIHQSDVVNSKRIRELQPWTHGEFAVVMDDGTTLVSSRTYSGALRDLLEL